MAIERDPYTFPPPGINSEMLRARMMGGSIFLTQPDPKPEQPMKDKCRKVTCAAHEGEACLRKETAHIEALQVPESRHGFFVDFTDCEDLLKEFSAAALKAGMAPSESALDLIYLFVSGDLYLKGGK